MLLKRLQTMGEVGAVRDEVCQWALTQKRTLYRAAAYRRVVIFVSLRMAANAEAPSSPISLSLILHSEGCGMGSVRG